MTRQQSTDWARAVVRDAVALPELLDQVADGDDLNLAGVDSGEIIQVAQRCEELLGRPLTSDELAGIRSISDVAGLLAGTEVP